jgi:quinol monooxygenase YgiN
MSLRRTGGLLAALRPPEARAAREDASMTKTVKIVATLVARPGRADQLKDLLLAMAAPSRAEPGNLQWDVWQDQAERSRFVLDEAYESEASVTAHRQTTHFANYLSRINDLAERNVVVLDAVKVA